MPSAFSPTNRNVADLILKLQKANIIGRGGAEYPAHKKWEAVRNALNQSSKGPGLGYVICNASEHEPAVSKDHFILEHHADKLFEGMKLAIKETGAREGIFSLNAKYYATMKTDLDARIAAAKKDGFSMRIVEATSYIGGEETALLNAIEGRRCEPRLKPPFPTQQGLHGAPTLIHNVETLYDIALVAEGTYDDKRFYTVSGAIPHPGIYRLPVTLTALQILEQTENVPQQEFFAQLGGGASGTVFDQQQLAHETVHGAGSVVVHLLKENPRELLLAWLNFFHKESCGKCTPCREGTYQLVRLLEDHKRIPWKKMQPILEVLEKTSFCALGRSVPIPVLSYYRNVLKKS